LPAASRASTLTFSTTRLRRRSRDRSLRGTLIVSRALCPPATENRRANALAHDAHPPGGLTSGRT
jgi:hypothetical protein